MDFRTLPGGDFTLANVSVPACLLGLPGDLVRTETSMGSRIAPPMSTAMACGGPIRPPNSSTTAGRPPPTGAFAPPGC